MATGSRHGVQCCSAPNAFRSRHGPRCSGRQHCSRLRDMNHDDSCSVRAARSRMRHGRVTWVGAELCAGRAEERRCRPCGGAGVPGAGSWLPRAKQAQQKCRWPSDSADKGSPVFIANGFGGFSAFSFSRATPRSVQNLRALRGSRGGRRGVGCLRAWYVSKVLCDSASNKTILQTWRGRRPSPPAATAMHAHYVRMHGRAKHI